MWAERIINERSSTRVMYRAMSRGSMGGCTGVDAIATARASGSTTKPFETGCCAAVDDKTAHRNYTLATRLTIPALPAVQGMS